MADQAGVANRPEDKGPAGVGAFLLNDLAPAFWTPELQSEESRWWPHVPFAFWLVAAARPRSLVELGTDRGVSYTAFCEAARRLELDARFFAVDNWLGDEDAGEEKTGNTRQKVFETFKAFHDRRYASFSQLVRADFDAAHDAFLDGSIDLLHIDGPQDYDAARAIYDLWKGKLSPRGVILLHGVRRAGENFGVGRLFGELAGGAPHFEFRHGDGLGLIATGPQPPESIAALCGLNEDRDAILRERFEFLGGRWQEREIAFSLMRQFDDDIAAMNPDDQRIRLPIHKRLAKSVQKTIDNPMRHFKKGNSEA
ncbi:class I SAM-dependent methyltransferase [Rhodoblastus sp. 17X3]|uniref:class I SAM-dependent methyltransferase n=1 Tax=Rhodoblastus sp. 17X3 TaxID=3047026 RepID=UPI0024B68EF8|nr:class I SAM-dependent methyltransferase [Rhodoblastus sp. 17X3]MDI9849075.1 class I SAM-dependent methyltransferase [Rhodoblastus sp. 17X3]